MLTMKETGETSTMNQHQSWTLHHGEQTNLMEEITKIASRQGLPVFPMGRKRTPGGTMPAVKKSKGDFSAILPKFQCLS